MRVVDRQDDGPVVGEVGGQPVQPVKRSEGRVSILSQLGPLLSKQSPRERGGAREESVALGLGRGADPLLEQLARHAEGKLLLEHRATRLHHLEACVPGERPCAGNKPALADPRRRLDQQRGSGALAGPRHGVPEDLQLALALEQVRDRDRVGRLS